jgi:hypothetical protein
MFYCRNYAAGSQVGPVASQAPLAEPHRDYVASVGMVPTGPGNLEKSWNFTNAFQVLEKSRNLANLAQRSGKMVTGP